MTDVAARPEHPSSRPTPSCSRTRCSRSSASSSARTAWSSGSCVCLLARGHCLIEGVPGLAKTLTVSTLAQVVGGTFARLQFTPDLVPADIVGTRIWRPSTRGLRHRVGPGLRQHRAGRRDQPRARQGAVGAAGGDGRAPGLDRRHDPRRCPTRSSCWPRRTRSSPRACTPCPRRSATGSSCRSSSGSRRTSEETEIARRMGVRRADGRAGADARAARSRCRRWPTTCSSTTRCRTTPCASSWPPATRRAGACRTWRRHIALGASPRGTLGLIAAGAGARGAARPPLRRAAGRVRRRARGAAPPHDADLRRAGRGRHHRRRGRAACSATCPRRASRPQQDDGTAPPHAGVRADRRRPPDDESLRSVRGLRRRGRRAGRGAAPPRAARSRAASTGCCSGDHHGLRLGPGSERAGARPYEAGDDARLHRLEPHRALADAPGAHHRGRPRAGDLDRRRPVGQPRLRHRRLREARRRRSAPPPPSGC